MNREDVLALYRPIRASIQCVLRMAVPVCSRADWTRAAKQLGLWAEGQVLVDDDDQIDMLADVALFEPNPRGRRSFAHFPEKTAQQLAPPDLALAHRMATASFSIFNVVERHETAGVWLEDLLDAGRRLWLMDEGLEASAPDGMVLGMRLFDAGQFHAGFGIIVPVDEETVEFCVQASVRGERTPLRYPLASTLYGDSIRAAAPIGPGDEELLSALLKILPTDFALPAGDRKRLKAKPKSPRKR